jgi:hypothetical protein
MGHGCGASRSRRLQDHREANRSRRLTGPGGWRFTRHGYGARRSRRWQDHREANRSRRQQVHKARVWGQ